MKQRSMLSTWWKKDKTGFKSKKEDEEERQHQLRQFEGWFEKTVLGCAEKAKASVISKWSCRFIAGCRTTWCLSTSKLRLATRFVCGSSRVETTRSCDQIHQRAESLREDPREVFHDTQGDTMIVCKWVYDDPNPCYWRRITGREIKVRDQLLQGTHTRHRQWKL